MCDDCWKSNPASFTWFQRWSLHNHLTCLTHRIWSLSTILYFLWSYSGASADDLCIWLHPTRLWDSITTLSGFIAAINIITTACICIDPFRSPFCIEENRYIYDQDRLFERSADVPLPPGYCRTQSHYSCLQPHWYIVKLFRLLFGELDLFYRPNCL